MHQTKTHNMENPEMNVEYADDKGVTLLDHFAGQALSNNNISTISKQELATIAYDIAEAMIEERKNRSL